MAQNYASRDHRLTGTRTFSRYFITGTADEGDSSHRRIHSGRSLQSRPPLLRRGSPRITVNRAQIVGYAAAEVLAQDYQARLIPS